MKLLLLNYSMNARSTVFSHQREVAKRLAPHFEHTLVITADEHLGEKTANIEIQSSNWKSGQSLKNAITFYRLVIPVILSQRKDIVVFSHMTEVQSFLIAPLCRLLGIPHFLWYAHKSNSKYLRLSFPFLNGVITSTPGSCPIRSSKVHPIGQAIDIELFGIIQSLPNIPPLRWYHVGRLDESKNIDLIIEVFCKLRGEGWDLKLDFYGRPSSNSAQTYFDTIRKKYLTKDNLDWLTFHGPIERARIPEIASHHDGFVHAFQGSLDKAVLEAVICKRVIVSTNPEFENEFSSFKSIHHSQFENLTLQLGTVLEMLEDEQEARIEAFYNITKQNHSLDKWIGALVEVITH